MIGDYKSELTQGSNDILVTIYSLASLSQLGVLTLDTPITTLSTQVWSWGEIGITLAGLSGLLAIFVGYSLNNKEFKEFDNRQTGIAMGLAVFNALLALAPTFSSQLTSNLTAAWMVFLAMAFGYSTMLGNGSVLEAFKGGGD